MGPFRHVFPVRFPDVDYARVVYYPRYFDYMHHALEEFVRAATGMSYRQMLEEQRIGFPAVHIEADYRSPLRYGDGVEVEIVPEDLRGRSLTWRYRIFRAGEAEPVCEARVTTAVVDMETFRARSLPEEIRDQFLAWSARAEP